MTDPDADDSDGVDPNVDALDADDSASACAVADARGPRWVKTPGEQVAKKKVFDVLDERFPRAKNKQDPYRQLREGFIGIAVDRPAREYVAIVDPALVDVEALDAELTAAANAEHAKRPTVRRITIRAQAGCHSSAKLLDALKRLPEIVRAHRGRIVWYPSAYDSRIHVSMNPTAPAAVAVRKQLGDVISFED